MYRCRLISQYDLWTRDRYGGPMAKLQIGRREGGPRRQMMIEYSVLVIGSSSQTTSIVHAFQAAGLRAWSERTGDVALDHLSLRWADALVVVDTTDDIETQRLRALAEFLGPSLLATTAPPDDALLASLLERGFDAVVPWPSSLEVMVARVRRMLEPGAGSVRRALAS